MQLKSFFTEEVGIEDELADCLAEISEVRTIRRGEYLVRAGEPQQTANLLVSGVLRGCLVDSSGRETTDCFYYRAGAPLLAGARLTDPSLTSVEALQDSLVVSAESSVFLDLLERSIPANQLHARLLADSWQENWDVKMVLTQMKARERYLWFLETYPGLIDKVPNKYVASFLGMTPVTLSRLRGALREEGRA